MLAQIASARVGELETEIAQRYGEPVSPYAYQQVNRDAVFEGIHSSSHLPSIEEDERDEETDLINLAEIKGFQFSGPRKVLSVKVAVFFSEGAGLRCRLFCFC